MGILHFFQLTLVEIKFKMQAQLLTVVHHRNLVSLIGYCDEGEIKALIYEYMANGNLQQLLLGNLYFL
jgi:serine/threonine protein kinase